MTWLDWSLLTLLAFGAGRGYYRGFMRELFELGGAIIGIVLAYRWAGSAAARLPARLGLPPGLIHMAVLGVVAVSVASIAEMVGRIAVHRVDRSSWTRFDRFGGLAVGLSKAGLIVAVVVVASQSLPLSGMRSVIDSSPIVQWTILVIPRVYEALGAMVPKTGY